MSADPDLKDIVGLSEEEAAERLLRDGYNELPSTKRRSLLAMGLDVVREPMFLLLITTGALYLILGDLQEAALLLSFVFVVIGITFYQERKTERALEALRDLTSPRALVIRGGEQRRIAGREVVRDDALVLKEGDRVPADAVVLGCINLSADESLLTGESVSVRKTAWDGRSEMGRPGGDDLPFVYSGTMVVQGQGIARVAATGLNTEIGRIGKALRTVGAENTALQREVARLVRNVAVLGLSLCAVLVVAYGLSRQNWLEGILTGSTLAMAILPEEFPVVLTIFVALGAWRIAKKRVLTRRVAAVETLGSASVLCVDKTGTLTQNRMSVRRIAANGESYDFGAEGRDHLAETFHQLVEFSILASQRDPFDPMEKALRQLGEQYLARTEHLHDNWRWVREYPLSRKLLALSHVWESPGDKDYVIAAKGAPEAIADLCHFDQAHRAELSAQIADMAGSGLRVLGVARAEFEHSGLPSEQHDFVFEFIGLVGLADPVRPAVPAAIQECYAAGIRVVMITGDYPGTAQNIAAQIGLAPREEVITGPQLDQMDEAELQRRVTSVNIFARVVPEQKLRLVNALKANGEIVAMTGDGVNDAPALKSAHIGIAMGGRGTDVAREASALVLLDDDFSSIVQAVRKGRGIFDNLRKAMAYIVAIHVPIAGMSLIPVFFGWPLVLMPVEIVFLELIIDPACSVVFEAEPEEANVMARPPRNPHEPLFGRRTVALSLLQGTCVLLVLLVVFVISLGRGLGEQEARALTFATLIIANLSLIMVNRSWSRSLIEELNVPNSAVWWVLGGAMAVLGVVLHTPYLRELFRFSFLDAIDLTIALLAGVGSVIWFEGYKWIGRRSKGVL
jgi:P-type Ca2+ transporter type 2C